jgi:hypothetical protein
MDYTSDTLPPVKRWLTTAPGWVFASYAVVVSFCLYTCIFALRKTFNVATFEGLKYAGVSYKVWLIIAQMAGYMLSKFAGIKVISELAAHSRAKGILIMVILAVLSWLLFAAVPPPYNIVFLFLNGLPLGMGWGLVFGYLEGRRSTDLLGAGVSVSFIFSAGFAKTVGGTLMQSWGVSEFWMPLAACGVFILPLGLSLWLMNQLPAPSAEDEALRTKRQPMSGADRLRFVSTFGIGLALLVFTYVLLTAYRDFRDNFSAEIWQSLGYGDKPAIFAQIETPVSLIVLVVIGSLMFIRNNRTALVINHLMVFFGMAMIGVSTWCFEAGQIEAPAWMLLVGLGLYFGYVQFNSIFFDRIIAAFRYAGTVGFLIYVADSCGYVGSMAVMLYKEFGQKDLSWLSFFVQGGYMLSLIGCTLILLSLVYFRRKLDRWNGSEAVQ